MISDGPADDFANLGWAIIPDVLAPDEVHAIRAQIAARFADEAAGTNVVVDVFSRWHELRPVLLDERIQDVARHLLGENYVILAEQAAHRRGYVGWHRDTTSQERGGERFHREPGYLMVEFALYLQDNTPEYGGGLEVVSGSHRLEDVPIDEPARPSRMPAVMAAAAFKARRALNRDTGARADATWVPSKAGDLVVFDFRLLHRASPRSARIVPSGREKYAIFIAASRNNLHVDLYHRFLLTRPDYDYLHGFRYPADLADAAALRGVTLATPG